MKPILTLLLLGYCALSTQAQSEEDYQYEYDHTYEYNHEYHHEWGMWGYRHEAKLLDSLSVLEMMDSVSRQEVAYQWEDFQEKKQKARKEKKEKKKKDKDKKDKKEKGDRKPEKGKKGGKGIGYKGGTETGEQRAEAGMDFGMPQAPSDASLTAGVGAVAPLRVMNMVPDAQERSALMAIYDQMNGKNWAYQDNWGSSEPLETWVGVTVENGDVVALELRRNNLTGGLPLTINKLSALEYLNLGGNPITSLPQQIGELTNLKALYFDECGLANLPPGLGSLNKLETLNLNYNRLSSLPSTIGQLKQLKRLFLYGNTLLTTLPPQVGGLSALENLFLYQSAITRLPEEIGQLKELRGLFPKETLLTELPESINDLVNLKFLNAADSKLKSLPPVDKLVNLKGVIVTGNQLEQIPNWKNHPNIENLFWRVDNNLVDLNQIAQNLSGVDTHPFVDFVYRPQESPTLVLPVAGSLLDPFPVKHPQSSYQWQRQVGEEWQDIAGATTPTYTGEQGSLYRCRLENAWLPGMVYYSHPLEPDAQGATTQWIEAECASVGSNWQVAESSSASEGQYVVYPQGEGVYRTSPSSDPADQLVYTVTVEQAQDYYLLARINAPSYSDDSFWVKIDAGDWITWSGGIQVGKGFAWNQLPGGAVFLAKGTHTILFTYREDGAQLDKLSLSLSSALPSGQGEAALACQSTGVAASLWVEGECAQIGSNWQVQESNSASGGQYVVCPSGTYPAGAPTQAADHVVYTLTIEQTQNYFLMARVNAPTYGDDSFWFKVDNNDWLAWGSGIKVNQGFQWNQAPGKALALTAGTHTITFASREDGTQLDKLALRLSTDLPTGLGEEAGECEVLPPYTPPAPPTVNNPPDNTTAPSVTGTRTPASNTNSNVNYVRSFSPRETFDDPADVNMTTAVSDVSVSTEYLDGLGRPIQTVVRGGGGAAGQDLVQPVEYDAYGRQEKQYLPYAESSASGGYRPNALVNQYDFYTKGPGNVAQSDYPYTQRQYEPSPLNRIQQQGAPGENWRLGSGHEVEMRYLVNTGSEVQYWTASNTLSSTALSGGSSYYGAGELYKTVTIDENDHSVTEFVDKQGQTVLKRVQGPDGDMDTYYVYDDYNLLRFVLPPEASKQLQSNASLAGSATFQEQYLFVYTYDARRRMTSKQVPGGGTTKMRYDQWNRLVASQSAEQGERGEWSVTKYDNLNRPIMTGVVSSLTSPSSAKRFETSTSSGVGYSLNQSYPVVNEAALRTVTYYDDYDFPHASDYSAPTGYRKIIKNQVTGTRVRNLENNQWLKSVSYYDEQQRPVVSETEHHLGGSDRVTTTYRNTVNSEVLKTVRVHKSSSTTHTITQDYAYDHQGRLLTVSHQLDNGAAVTLSAQRYNAIGELIQKELGNSQQRIAYRYNIRGWLEKINELESKETYFNQEFYYDFGFEEKQHNGNISGVQWSRAGGKAHAYGYLYDEANRITGADYRLKEVGNNWSATPGNFTVDKVSYDKNGNIEVLKRYGQVGDERIRLLDDLSYTYQGNRLASVQDQGEADYGFVDGASTGSEYGYDASGNMTKDENKGISDITYDAVLNLPEEVVITDKGTIRYSYDAAGMKLRQVVTPTDGSPTKTTDYVSGFHYEDGKLSFVQHEEGRLMLEGEQAGAYHYDLKDHLGNTRVTFSSKPVTTTAMASMEKSSAAEEEAVFEGVAESRQTLAFHNTTDESIQEPKPQQVATLLPGEEVLGKSLEVHSGDTVRLKVNARYETAPQQVQGLEGVATEIAGALQKTATGLESTTTSGGLNGLGATGAIGNEQQEAPNAYLNYLLYDEDYQLIDQGFQKVSKKAAVGKANPDDAAETLALEVPIEEEGFLYAYLSNEPSGSGGVGVANSGTPVYFDDFTVEQQSYIVQVDDYYPFGMTHRQPLNRNLANWYLYQSQELTNDFGLGIYQFPLRSYDPATGRWWQPDPYDQFHSPYVGMGNNPIIGIDPTGGICPTCPDEGAYDQFRDSDAAFAYNQDVGVYNDVDIMVMGSSDFDNIQVVRGSDNLTVGDVMDMQSQLNNVEGLVATFNPENVGAILMMAEGGGVNGGGAKSSVPRVNSRGVNSTTPSLDVRAKEIHSALPEATQRRTTTAVGEVTNSDGTRSILVGSSETRLRPAQRAVLKAGETEVKGVGHAEQTVVNHARANRQQVNAVGASRPICSNCEDAIQQAGGTPVGKLKKKP